jgi:hypothetical protein
MKHLTIFLMASICLLILPMHAQSQCSSSLSIDKTYQQVCAGSNEPKWYTATIQNPIPNVSYTIKWYRSNGTLYSTGASVAPSDSFIPAGSTSASFYAKLTYTYNGSSCTSTSPTCILVRVQPPDVSFSYFGVCQGTSVNIWTAANPTPNNGQWTAPATTLSQGIFNPNGTLPVGSYPLTYTVTGTAGCKTTKPVSGKVEAKPVTTITPTSAQICSGQSATLTATSTVPNSLFFWHNTFGAMNCPWYGCGPTLTTSSPGSYRVFAKNGYCSGDLSDYASINQVLAGTPSITQTYNLCSDGFAVLTADGPLFEFTQPMLSWNTGQTGTSIEVYTAGDYYVVANFDGVCSRMSSVVQVIGCTVPCDPFNPCESRIDQSSIDAFPFPAKDVINIGLKHRAQTRLPLQLLNGNGQVVLSSSIEKDQQSITLPTGKLRGLHFLKLETPNGAVVKKVFFVND